MKKYLLIFFILFFITISNNNSSVEPVFKELTFQKIKYCIDVKNENVNTNNIQNYFNKLEIISVYPYFNDSYKKVLGGDLKFYNLDYFFEEYKKLLNKIGKMNWVTSFYEGVKIEKVELFAYDSDIEKLLSKYRFKKCDYV